MADTERLHFKVGLSGTYWDRKPAYSVWVNNTEYGRGTASEEVEYVEFDCELPEGPNSIVIKLENKTNRDTIVEGGNIVKDMLLNINSIEIDDIDLGTLLWTASEFVGTDPARPVLKNCVNLGWNGSYIINFNSPFYLWLLENM